MYNKDRLCKKETAVTTTDRFINAFARLLAGNFFTSATDVRHFLTALSNDPELRAVLTTSVDGFRSEDEYRKVFAQKQPLPDRPEKVVALVTAFLFRVDSNRVSLADELARLFPALDSANAYKAFGKEYLEPYAECFVSLLTGSPTDEVEEKKPVYDKMNEDLTALLIEFEGEVKQQPLEDTIADELVDAIRGMKYALSFNDAILTAFSYHRIAYLTEQARLNLPAERELKSVLRLYGVM